MFTQFCIPTFSRHTCAPDSNTAPFPFCLLISIHLPCITSMSQQRLSLFRSSSQGGGSSSSQHMQLNFSQQNQINFSQKYEAPPPQSSLMAGGAAYKAPAAGPQSLYPLRPTPFSQLHAMGSLSQRPQQQVANPVGLQSSGSRLFSQSTVRPSSSQSAALRPLSAPALGYSQQPPTLRNGK